MKHEFAPQTLNVAAFANEGARHSASEKLAHFHRLMEETAGLGGETPVDYSVQGHIQTDASGLAEPWIELSANTSLMLTCQRCLGPVDVPVVFDRKFRFVANEELAAIEDEESEEDVLVLSKSFNLLELIEDELLMSMPPAPKHDVCPKVVKLQAADTDFVDAPVEKANPFAVLQQLKKS
jgi:uncharacterized protein